MTTTLKQEPFNLAMLPILIAERVKAEGGRCLMVGGCVRDKYMGKVPVDYDLEVYGLEPERILGILAVFDNVDLVGESFSVFKLHHYPIDVCLPRKERKIDVGHKGFETVADSQLDMVDAFKRRDFTMNSIGFDPLNGHWFDYYGGREDIDNGVIRHTSGAFEEDPLRPLRAIRFSSQLGFSIDPQTIKVCEDMSESYYSLPKERLWGEWSKILKGPHVDMAFEALKRTGYVRFTPELRDLLGCQQDPNWHPEGDVYTHTAYVINEANKVISRENLEQYGFEANVLRLAALCHDIGKPATTVFEEDGRITTKGHATVGALATEGLLIKIGAWPTYIKPVTGLVREHMVMLDEGSHRAVRRLAHRLALDGTTIKMLCLLGEADNMGRLAKEVPRNIKVMAKLAEQLQVVTNAPPRILMGRHIGDLGIPVGPYWGKILSEVYEAQLDGEVTSLEDGLKLAKSIWGTINESNM